MIHAPYFEVMKRDLTMAHSDRKTYDNGAVMLGVPTVHAKFGLEGQGVKVLIIDDGYTEHDNLPTPIEIRSFGYSKTLSDTGHGNYLFGIMAMQGNPYTGIAPKADYYIAKYYDRRGGSLDGMADALEWGIDIHPHIIVISSGASGMAYNVRVHRLLQECYKRDIAVHLTTGNAFGQSIKFPNNLSEVITTGAIDIENKTAVFNSLGDSIDFVCYGVDVLSTNNNNSHDTVKGSSFANPYDAACGVILQQKFIRDIGRRPTILEYGSIMIRYAKDLTKVDGWDIESGYGIPQLSFIEDLFQEGINEPVLVSLSEVVDYKNNKGCLGLFF